MQRAYERENDLKDEMSFTHNFLHSNKIQFIQAVSEELQRLREYIVELEEKVDKKIIAGFVLDFDDIQFDASAKKKLNKMQKQLTRNN